MKSTLLLAFTLWLGLPLPANIEAQSKTPRSNSRKAKLTCSPSKLFRGDTLSLDMAVPHGGDLAVRAPDGTDFFVVYQAHDEGPGAASLMDPDKFMKVGQLELVTDKTKARPWVYGRDKNELIFTRSGWYSVRLSENLQTDDGTPVYQCRVYYNHKPRP